MRQGFALFAKEHGPHGLNQLKRIARQVSRMSHVAEVLNTDSGIDPDTNEKININPEPLLEEKYDERISPAISKSAKRGWAIETVENCLFIGAYTGEFQKIAQGIFSEWFYGCGGTKEDPTSNMLASMTHSLIPSIFSRPFSASNKIDLLFDRATVLLALHLDKFIELAKNRPFELRWGSRKESALFNKPGTLKRNKRVLIAQAGDEKIAIADGFIARIFFNGHTPSNILDAIESMFTHAAENTSTD